jgi:hypothetical protein
VVVGAATADYHLAWSLALENIDVKHLLLQLGGALVKWPKYFFFQ